MTTMYVDAFTSELVPVKPVRFEWDFDDERVVVVVLRTVGPYQCGEELVEPLWNVVYKSHMRGIHQMVRTVPRADLLARMGLND